MGEVTIQQQLKDAKQEIKRLKKYLISSTDNCIVAISAMDSVGRKIQPDDAGSQFAKFANTVEIANDMALHFGLDMSFPEITKHKAKIVSRARYRE